MVSLTKKIDNAKLSFFQFFRPTFVIFFLYLLGDAIYRWDGFKYYASFSEFIPSLSLVTILWGIASVISALIIWGTIRFTECMCRYKKINSLPFLTFIYALYTSMVTAIIALNIKSVFWPRLQTTFSLKLIVLLIAVLIATVIAYLIRNRLSLINEHITPLVWLFCIWVMLSVPIAAFQFLESHKVKFEVSKGTQDSISGKARPNIVLVTFDALRARDMSVYGFPRDTTPFISMWARSASVFSKLQASSTYTTPATASLMTGKRVWTHQTFQNQGSKPVKSYNESLPSILKKNGYYTAAFVGAEPATAQQLGIDHDFDLSPYAGDFIKPHSLLGYINRLLYKSFSDKFRLHDWILKRDFVFYQVLTYVPRIVTRTDHITTSIFERFVLSINEQIEEPFFAWIHLHSPHDPYLPRQPFMGMFNASLELRTRESQGELLDGTGIIPVTEDMQDVVNTLRARYDENIRYCDHEFENFINKLSERNLLNNTIVILSSDHGESFEHNVLGHGCLDLFEEVTNIPLIIKVPGNTENKIIGNAVEQIDVPATILDFAGIPVPAWMEGRSVRPLIYGEPLVPKPAFSMALFNNGVGRQISKGAISVWVDDHKLIHYLEENKSLLFNLRDDPYEMSDIYHKEPEVGKHLSNLIKDNLKKANERIAVK